MDEVFDPHPPLRVANPHPPDSLRIPKQDGTGTELEPETGTVGTVF